MTPLKWQNGFVRKKKTVEKSTSTQWVIVASQSNAQLHEWYVSLFFFPVAILNIPLAPVINRYVNYFL